MIRGTTPTLEFSLPFEASVLKEAYITLAQKNKVILDKSLVECVCDGSSLSVTLTQEETLLLSSEYKTEIQLRVKTWAGEALVSNIMVADTERILKDGVI